MTLLETENGRTIALHRRKTPWPMDDRTMVCAYFFKRDGKGGFYFSFSTLPCADLEVKYKDQLKGTTVATAENVLHICPHANGGTSLKQRIHMDPKGSIPDVMKNKAAKKQWEALESLSAYIRSSKF